MNVRGGLALVRATWASWMQYRGFFFVLAFGWMVPPLVSLFVWTTAAGEGTLGGYSRGAFVAYYLALVLVNQLTYAQANWTLGDVIRDGSLNFWLLKPMPALFNVIASEGAGKTVTLAFVIPAAAALALALRPEARITPAQVGWFLLSLGLAWGLRFLWGCWLALLAFWSNRADGLLAVQDALIFLLSGVAAPVSLLPDPVRALANALPFRYMVSFPVEVLLGQARGADLWTGLAAQAGWLALAAALSAALWRGGLKRYAAVGG